MNVTNLELVNFRNYSKIKFNNFKKINVIIGKNSIGKTSILESIYFGSLTKSFRSSSEDVLIKTNEEFLKVKIRLEESNKTKKLEIILNNTGKKTKINGNIKKKLSEYIFQYRVILFSPDELKILKESPMTRRSYLNIEISQIDKSYIKKLNNYNILIKNKNDYLKKLYLNKNLDLNYIDVLDEKIADLGLDICLSRRNYINDINKFINKKFKKFMPTENIKINYISDFDDLNKREAIKLLKSNRNKEIILGITSTGVHRDDIIFLHNDKNSREYSSQGIQKLIMLSMKLSELEIFIKKYNINPILLLDDLFSELDNINQNKVIEFLNKKVQVFITTTDLNNIDNNLLKKSKIIELKDKVNIYE